MDVKQIADFANAAAKESTGESAVFAEDLSNVVDAGNTVINHGIDKFVKALPDQIGKVIFDNRAYIGEDLGILRDSWEYGSIVEKIRADIPEATENESWELEDGEKYEQDLFTKPNVNATFWNKMTTFEIPVSIADRQVKSAFQSAGQLGAFISMIYTQVQNGIKIRLDDLQYRVINNQIAETVYSEVNTGAITGRSGAKSINLLYLYNTAFGTSLTAAAALTNADFLKFAAYQISLYPNRLKKASKLFNMGSRIKFTSDEYRKVILLDDFAKAIGPYSMAPAYNKEYLALPDAKTIACWQGTGTDFGFSSVSKVDVTSTAAGHAKTVTGVLGVIFDKEACAICCENQRVTAHYNAKAEFTNQWHKNDARYLVDNNENFIVFYVA